MTTRSKALPRRSPSLRRRSPPCAAGSPTRRGRRGFSRSGCVEPQASLAGVTAQNERLAATLREARDQIVALKEEVDRLAQPPSGFGVFLARHDDGTADVFTGGRKLRVNVSPGVELDELRPRPGSHAQRGAQRRRAPGLRDASAKSSCSRSCSRTASARWSSRTPTRSAWSGSPSRCATSTLRAGDSLLLEPRSGYVYERIPKAEVEELVLEEVPDIDYSRDRRPRPRRSSRSATRSSCRTCTRTCSASTSCGRRRACCSTARPAAARR